METKNYKVQITQPRLQGWGVSTPFLFYFKYNVMVECICIDDSNRPKEIPANKWVKKDNEYNIIFTITVLPQKELGVVLAEIELTDKELPYEYFLAKRFAFTEEALKKLIELIKDCSDINFSMDELLEQTQLAEL